MSHWTQGNVGDFVYSLSLDFFTQLEDQIRVSKLQQKDLAEKLGISASAVSQMLNNPPEKPELETLVKYARAVGSKVSVVLYNDGDPTNERGPVYSGIFEQSWEALNRPQDLEAVSGPLKAEYGVPCFKIYGNQPLHYWGFAGSPLDDKGSKGHLISTDGSISLNSGWKPGTASIIPREWTRQETEILQPKEQAA